MSNYIDRMKDELDEVTTRYVALGMFMASAEFDKLDVIKRGLLKIQEASMRTYMDTLELRIGMDNDVVESFYE